MARVLTSKRLVYAVVFAQWSEVCPQVAVLSTAHTTSPAVSQTQQGAPHPQDLSHLPRGLQIDRFNQVWAVDISDTDCKVSLKVESNFNADHLSFLGTLATEPLIES